MLEIASFGFTMGTKSHFSVYSCIKNVRIVVLVGLSVKFDRYLINSRHEIGRPLSAKLKERMSSSKL
jgi:hypothetical protein